MAKSIISSQIREILLEEASKGNHLTEDSIARQLNLSRTPVRESLKYLEEEGILERKQRTGIKLKKLSLREIIEVYDLRSVMEGLACRLLAPVIREETLKKLRKLSQKYDRETRRKNSAGSAERTKVELDFHHLIVSACGSEKLRKILESLHFQTLSFQISNELELKGLDFKDKKRYPHEAIVKALEKRDPDEAEMSAKLHVQEQKEKILQLFLGSSILPVYKGSVKQNMKEREW